MTITALAQSTVIYTDDFEGTVSGWSDNRTEFDPDTTTFLGRFDNSPDETSRIFTIPAGMDRVEITFDLYRFDSWDNTAQWGFDRFQIDIDGTQIFSLPFASSQSSRSGTTGNVDWSHIPLGPASEFAFNTGQYWLDQKHEFTIVVNNPGPTLDLVLRTALNQGGNDESGGYDNFTIEAFPVPPDVSVTKTVEVLDSIGLGDYALPGNEVEYVFTLLSNGGALDSDSIVLTDTLPDDIIIFTGDYDGSGNPVIFQDNSAVASGVSCCSAGDYEFSNTISGAPVFGYTPTSSYDDSVTYIRLSPLGSLRAANVVPVELEFRFKARIK